MGQTPEIEDLILGAIEQSLDSVYTVMPGVVIDYDPSLRAATVQPLVPQAYIAENGDRVIDSYAPLQRVPVVFPGGAFGELLFPIQKGDHVILHFANCALDRYKATGAEVDPGNDRRHHLGDAVATPGLRSFRNPGPTPTDRVALTGNLVCLGDVAADQAVVVQSALDFFGLAIKAALVAIGITDPPATHALTALQTALGIDPITGRGWNAGTSKTKAK